MTVKVWLERLPDIVKDYEPRNQWNMDELRLFFETFQIEFSIKDFSSKCDQIRRKLWIWSHLLKKSLMENFIFCAVKRLVQTIPVFVIADASNPRNPIVIWQS